LIYTIALLTNFVGLIFSVWLGVYIITHSRRSPVAWFAGLTLWALASIFAHILLGIFSSPRPLLSRSGCGFFSPFGRLRLIDLVLRGGPRAGQLAWE
jgi:hypothetical protein